MGETTSLIILGCALFLLGLAAWQARRERAPGALPIVPWTGVQFVALVAVVLIGIHLVGLWTGQDLKGRNG